MMENPGDDSRKFGMTAGHTLIRALKCKPSCKTSNEFSTNGKRAVMKTARSANAIEVSYAMMERLDVVFAAFLRARKGAMHEFVLYKMSIGDFRELGRPAFKPNQHRLGKGKIDKTVGTKSVKCMGTKKVLIPR